MAVAYDATGAGGLFLTSGSFTHTPVASGTDVFLFIAPDRPITLTGVTYGGTAMTLLGSVNDNNSSSNGTVYLYHIANVSSSAATVSISNSTAAWVASNTVGYKGVGSVGSTVTNYGSGTSLSSASITCPSNGMVINGFGVGNSGVATGIGTVSGGNSRYNAEENSASVAIGDATSTATFTATVPTSDVWGSIGVALSPSGGGGYSGSPAGGTLTLTGGTPVVSATGQPVVAYDSTGGNYNGVTGSGSPGVYVSSYTSGTAETYTHTTVATATKVLIFAAVGANLPRSNYTPTFSIGGVTATSLGYQDYDNLTSGNTGWIEVFEAALTSSGAKTVSGSYAFSGSATLSTIFIGSLAFTGVQSASWVTPTYGNPQTESISVPSGPGDLAIVASSSGPGFGNPGNDIPNGYFINGLNLLPQPVWGGAPATGAGSQQTNGLWVAMSGPVDGANNVVFNAGEAAMNANFSVVGINLTGGAPSSTIVQWNSTGAGVYPVQSTSGSPTTYPSGTSWSHTLSSTFRGTVVVGISANSTSHDGYSTTGAAASLVTYGGTSMTAFGGYNVYNAPSVGWVEVWTLPVTDATFAGTKTVQYTKTVSGDLTVNGQSVAYAGAAVDTTSPPSYTWGFDSTPSTWVSWSTDGAGYEAVGTNPSWSHTAAAHDWVFVWIVGSGSASITTAPTYGGSAMTAVGNQPLNNSTANGTIWLYYIKNVAAGAATIQFTGSNNGWVCQSRGYNGVGSIGTPTFHYASSTGDTQTITLTEGQCAIFGAGDTGTSTAISMTSYGSMMGNHSVNPGYALMDNTTHGQLAMSDTNAQSTTFTAAGGSSNWGSIGLVLNPAWGTTAAGDMLVLVVGADQGLFAQQDGATRYSYPNGSVNNITNKNNTVINELLIMDQPGGWPNPMASVGYPVLPHGYETAHWAATALNLKPVAASGGTTITPGTGTMALSGGTASIGLGVSPTTAALSLVAGVPTVTLAFNLTPTAAALTLTGGTATVVAPYVGSPGAAALTLTGGTPTVSATNNIVASPTSATLTLTAGTATLIAPFVASPGSAALVLTGGTAGVANGQSTTLTPASATLTLTGGTPSIGLGVSPATATLTLSAGMASLNAPFLASPGGSTFALSAGTPIVTIAASFVITPPSGSLHLTGGNPAVVQTTNYVGSPAAAVLRLVGGTPTVSNSTALTVTGTWPGTVTGQVSFLSELETVTVDIVNNAINAVLQPIEGLYTAVFSGIQWNGLTAHIHPVAFNPPTTGTVVLTSIASTGALPHITDTDLRRLLNWSLQFAQYVF